MKITIITAVFNNVAEISTAMDSVLSQTYQNIEYIVIDGGSDDGTVEAIESLSSNSTRFISEPDGGIYHALNKGIAMATGDVIGLLHSDDIFDNPKVLDKIAEVFRDTDCDAVYGDLEYVSKNDPSKVVRYWESSEFDLKKFKRGWMPAHPTLFLKRKVYDKFGVFDTRYKIAADYDLILRTLGSGTLRCEYIPMVITRMRLGGVSNRGMKNIWRKSYEDWQALRRNKKGNLFVLFRKNSSKLCQFVKKSPRKLG